VSSGDDLKDTGSEDMDPLHVAQDKGPVAVSCEYDNEAPCFIRGKKYSHRLLAFKAEPCCEEFAVTNEVLSVYF
jgi:hypothetical protein